MRQYVAGMMTSEELAKRAKYQRERFDEKMNSFKELASLLVKDYYSQMDMRFALRKILAWFAAEFPNACEKGYIMRRTVALHGSQRISVWVNYEIEKNADIACKASMRCPPMLKKIEKVSSHPMSSFSMPPPTPKVVPKMDMDDYEQGEPLANVPTDELFDFGLIDFPAQALNEECYIDDLYGYLFLDQSGEFADIVERSMTPEDEEGGFMSDLLASAHNSLNLAFEPIRAAALPPLNDLL